MKTKMYIKRIHVVFSLDVFLFAYPIVNFRAVQYAWDGEAGWRWLDNKHMAKYQNCIVDEISFFMLLLHYSCVSERAFVGMQDA